MGWQLWWTRLCKWVMSWWFYCHFRFITTKQVRRCELANESHVFHQSLQIIDAVKWVFQITFSLRSTLSHLKVELKIIKSTVVVFIVRIEKQSWGSWKHEEKINLSIILNKRPFFSGGEFSQWKERLRSHKIIYRALYKACDSGFVNTEMSCSWVK